MDGLHLMTAIHKIDKDIPVMMLTCEADEECIKAAGSLGAANYLVKPLQLSSLFALAQSLHSLASLSPSQKHNKP